jgi:hypothetical protein
MLRDIFHAKLERGYDVLADGGPQALRKAAADILRGNEVEPARLRPRWRWELCRIKIFEQGYAATFSVEAS